MQSELALAGWPESMRQDIIFRYVLEQHTIYCNFANVSVAAPSRAAIDTMMQHLSVVSTAGQQPDQDSIEEFLERQHIGCVAGPNVCACLICHGPLDSREASCRKGQRSLVLPGVPAREAWPIAYALMQAVSHYLPCRWVPGIELGQHL
jgi:hypothetical protein